MVTEDLSENQLKNLWSAIEKDENVEAKNMLKLVLFTGMRKGELFKLKWEDVDFERGFIHIRGPKGGIDQKIPMNNRARQVLKDHPKTSDVYVFPGKNGQQRREIRRPIDRIRKRADLPARFRSFHGLRHLFASNLASSGSVDLYQLQKLLTHKDSRMTQRYAHLRDEALKKASLVVDDLYSELNNDEVKKNAK